MPEGAVTIFTVSILQDQLDQTKDNIMYIHVIMLSLRYIVLILRNKTLSPLFTMQVGCISLSAVVCD